MSNTYKQKIELPLCPYALQECNVGADPVAHCAGIQAADPLEWKRQAEAKVDCKYRGAELSQSAYRGRYKIVHEKPAEDKEVF